MRSMVPFDTAAAGLVALGRACHARGWGPATSGNFSAVLARDPLRLAITPMGADKGALVPGEILEIDAEGRVLRGVGEPSAETALHVAIARARSAGAVAHTHSLWATLLSEAHAARGAVEITGFELLKGLSGVTTHEHREVVPIIENTQDWTAAAPAVEAVLARHPDAHAFLIRRHGLYTWGLDLDEARRHVETIEFLLEALGRS